MRRIISIFISVILIFLTTPACIAEQKLDVLAFATWGSADEVYLTTLVDEYIAEGASDESALKTINLLYSQNNDIIKDINHVKTLFIATDNGAKLYPPDVTGAIHVLYTAFKNRNSLIEAIVNKEDLSSFNYDADYFTEGRTFSCRYEISGLLSEENIEHNYSTVFRILNSDMFPTGFLKDIEVYISPYGLKGVGGYSSTLNVPGREEYIVVAYNDADFLSSAKGVILHELGHVFEGDVAGVLDENDSHGFMLSNQSLWGEYKQLYPLWKPSDSWSNSLKENMAEDFKCYMSAKLEDISGVVFKINEFQYDDLKVGLFFDRLFEQYAGNGNESFSRLTLKFAEYKEELPLNITYYDGTFVTGRSFIIKGNYQGTQNNRISVVLQNDETKEAVSYLLGNGKTTISPWKDGVYSVYLCLMLGEKRVAVGKFVVRYDSQFRYGTNNWVNVK